MCSEMISCVDLWILTTVSESTVPPFGLFDHEVGAKVFQNVCIIYHFTQFNIPEHFNIHKLPSETQISNVRGLEF